MASVKKILCTIDFTNRSYDVLDKAIELAFESEAELHLIHVVSRLKNLEEYQDQACSIAEHIAAREILDSYLKLSAIREQWVPKAVRSRLHMRQGDTADES